MEATMDNTPHFETIDGEKQLVVDGRPLTLLAGEVHNSSGSSAAWMERAWDKAD